MSFLEVNNHINKFDPCIVMRKNICNTKFLTYKIFNPFVNGNIFSGPNNTKHLVPS